MRFINRHFILKNLVLCLLMLSPLTLAQQIWTQDPIDFVRGLSGAPSDPQNQDRITDNVWLTRSDEGAGLFNIAPGAETQYFFGVSPEGTEWAFSGLDNNPASISAEDFASLNFTDWQNALGGMGSLLSNIIDRPGVVHLIEDNIYIDITFTEWGSQGSGNFRYTRASAEDVATSPTPEKIPFPGIGLIILSLIFVIKGALLLKQS